MLVLQVKYTYGDLKYDIVCGFIQDPRKQKYLHGQVEGAWYMGDYAHSYV
jgi:hypothetical protein